MAYRVRMLADSIGHNGVRLTTWELTYPRFVHAELMTHRLFSRNSASSRAIPTKKLMRQIRRDPAMPVWWGKNQTGMQAREELTGWRLALVKRLWLSARWGALAAAWLLGVLGFHKQIANRILEPWMFITVIVTATEWDNWFKLRCHPDAQPEIGWVAKEMQRQYLAATPRLVAWGMWHAPLVSDEEYEEAFDKGPPYPDFQKISAGRCARVSYLTHDGKRDWAADVELAEKLMKSGHWSPFEHVAQAMPCCYMTEMGVENGFNEEHRKECGQDTARDWSGNLRGWTQYRATIDPTFTVVGR